LIESAAAPTTASLRDRMLVAAFMFGHFTHHVTNALLTPLLPLIRDGFGLSYAQSGFLVSAFTLSQGLSQAPIGVLADRVGSRSVVTVGLILSALLCFLIGLAADYPNSLFCSSPSASSLGPIMRRPPPSSRRFSLRSGEAARSACTPSAAI
jgi:MFS family permease